MTNPKPLSVSEEMIEAGLAAQDEICLAMQKREHSETPEELPDYDEGDMMRAIYLAMKAAEQPIRPIISADSLSDEEKAEIRRMARYPGVIEKLPPISSPVSDDEVERVIRDLAEKLYAHNVIKYDPAAAERCIAQAIAALSAMNVDGMREALPNGDAGDALDWALYHIDEQFARLDFLECWRSDDLEEWPGYMKWLAHQRKCAAEARTALETLAKEMGE